MKMLLHICCAPCSIYPLKILRKQNFFVMGYFYRYNIHPFTECMKREKTVKEYADNINLKLIISPEYLLENFLQKLAFRENNRCMICYNERLKKTALIAKKGAFDYFTTTLLYSKYQNHEMIKNIGENIGKKAGVKFYYEDFTKGWIEGIEESKQLKMYRQQYCGCIYSEKERMFQNEKK